VPTSDVVAGALRLTEASGFDRNTYKQIEAIKVVSEMWQPLDKASRDAIAAHWAKRLPRCKRSNNGEAVFRRLVTLRDDADLYRALRVGESPAREWQSTKDERIYPSNGWIGAYLEHVKHGPCNIAMHFWSALSVLGAICHRKFYFDMGHFPLFLNQYVILAGGAQCGNGVALGNAMDLLERFNRRANERYAHRTSGLGTVSPDTVTIIPALTQEDRIAAAMCQRRDDTGEEATDETGILFIKSMHTFLRFAQTSPESRLSLLSELWDGQPYSAELPKNRFTRMKRPLLSMLGLASVQWLRGKFVECAQPSGIIDRATVIHRSIPSRDCPLPLEPADPVVAEGLVDDMLSWVDRRITVFHATPAGAEWADEWKKRAKIIRLDNGHADRSIDHLLLVLWKTAGLLALSYGEAPYVSDERFRQAATIIDHERENTARALGVMAVRGGPSLYEGIVRWMNNRGGCATKYELTNNFTSRLRRRGHHLNDYIQVLEDNGHIVRTNNVPGVWRTKEHKKGCAKCDPIAIARAKAKAKKARKNARSA
jgi:hypothetical protein